MSDGLGWELLWATLGEVTLSWLHGSTLDRPYGPARATSPAARRFHCGLNISVQLCWFRDLLPGAQPRIPQDSSTEIRSEWRGLDVLPGFPRFGDSTPSRSLPTLPEFSRDGGGRVLPCWFCLCDLQTANAQKAASESPPTTGFQRPCTPTPQGDWVTSTRGRLG